MCAVSNSVSMCAAAAAAAAASGLAQVFNSSDKKVADEAMAKTQIGQPSQKEQSAEKLSAVQKVFDEQASDCLVKEKGLCEYILAVDYHGRKSIYLNQLKASGAENFGESETFVSKGFGTAAIRSAFKISVASGREGHVHTRAAFSSHIFYLLMGFVPNDREEAYYCGRGDMMRMSWYFNEVSADLKDKKKLNDNQQAILLEMKKLYAREHRLKDSAQVTDEMVIKAEDFFLSLTKKKVSCLKEEFIPGLLEILEKQVTKKKPNTQDLNIVEVMLSDAGLKRWMEAIKQGKKFQLFRRFEQLQPFMTAHQVQRLNAILDQRERIFGKKS